MKMISSMVGGFMEIGIIALIIVFQQEIRKFLLLIGSTDFATKKNLTRRFNFFKDENIVIGTNVEDILGACEKNGCIQNRSYNNN